MQAHQLQQHPSLHHCFLLPWLQQAMRHLPQDDSSQTVHSWSELSLAELGLKMMSHVWRCEQQDELYNQQQSHDLYIRASEQMNECSPTNDTWSKCRSVLSEGRPGAKRVCVSLWVWSIANEGCKGLWTLELCCESSELNILWLCDPVLWKFRIEYTVPLWPCVLHKDFLRYVLLMCWLVGYS